MRVNGNVLFVSATNMPELSRLLAQAEKEMEQLEKTIFQLSHFEMAIHFCTQSADQAGDMEEASSVMSTMPTK